MVSKGWLPSSLVADRVSDRLLHVALAKAGAEVFILNRSGADDTVRMIENDGGKGYFISTDVTREEDVEAAFAKIIMQSGS